MVKYLCFREEVLLLGIGGGLRIEASLLKQDLTEVLNAKATLKNMTLDQGSQV